MAGKDSFDELPGLEDDYDQIQKVAIGGMAEVFRGRQKSLDRPVAIKKVRPEYRQSVDLKERFKREARASANLLHHNLAHVYDYRESEGESYIIMEFIDGFDLAQVLERAGTMPVDVAAMIATKILQGLVQVHSHGMIHRDIKPDNIRLTTRGEIKIMDFGIALDPGEMNLTQPGVLIGSPHYLAPEQIKGDRLDSRVDIFSFGITFYEMLAGKRPFFESGGESVYSRIRSGKYEPLDKVKPGLPSFLVNVVERCLEVNPEKRPGSAEKLAQALQEFLLHHYSLGFESRIKKYLMEAGLLRGNPSLIDTLEKTADTVIRRAPSSSSKLTYFLMALVGVLLLVLGGISTRSEFFMKLIGQTSDLSLPEAPAVTAEPVKKTPRSRPKPVPVPDAPGNTPVEAGESSKSE